MRVQSAARGEHRGFFSDAILDTGARISAIPASVVHQHEQSGIPLRDGRKRLVRSVHGVARSDTCWFKVSICPLPKPVADYSYQQLDMFFQSIRPLYSSFGRPLTLEGSQRGRPSDSLEMTVTDRPFAIIGSDIMAEWLVLIDGPTQRFKVARGSRWRWLVCCLGPKFSTLWRRGDSR
jgi:hypothetical protein